MEKIKSALALMSLGVVIGGVLVWILLTILGARPTSVAVGPVEFEIPTATVILQDTVAANNVSESPLPSQTLTVKPSSTVTNTPRPTDTPYPTNTPKPTSTPLPSRTPTAIVTNTPPNSELNVGETWVQDGVWLTLETVALGISNSWYHEFTFYIENHTGKEIIFNPQEATIEILDQNHVYKAEMHSYRDPYPENRLAPGEGNRFIVFFNTLYQFDPFSTSVDYFYIRVTDYSRIGNAVWKIEVSH